MLNAKLRIALSYLILALAVSGIIWGIFSGECETVLTKATNVCLECIGIG